MRNKKRGLKRRKSFFRGNKLVLDSVKSKVAFFVIVFLLGIITLGLLNGKLGMNENSVYNENVENLVAKKDAVIEVVSFLPTDCANESWNTYGHDIQRTFASGGCFSGQPTTLWRYVPPPAPVPEQDANFPVQNVLAFDDNVLIRYSVKMPRFPGATPHWMTGLDLLSSAGIRQWFSHCGINIDFAHWPAITNSGSYILFNDDGLCIIESGSGIVVFGPYSQGGRGEIDTWGEIVIEPSQTLFYTVNDFYLDGPPTFVAAYHLGQQIFIQEIWRELDTFSYYSVTDNLGGGLAFDEDTLFYAPFFSGPIANSNLINYSFPSGVYAFYNGNGMQKWYIPTWPATRISADNGLVYLVETGCDPSTISILNPCIVANLVARSQINGMIVWSQQINRTLDQVVITNPNYVNLLHVGDIAQAPVIADGKVIIPTEEGIAAFDALTGIALWATPMSLAFVPPVNFHNRGLPPSVSGVTIMAAALGSQTLVVTAQDGMHILALNDGSEIWRGMPELAQYRVRDPVIVGDRVYVIETDNEHYPITSAVNGVLALQITGDITPPSIRFTSLADGANLTGTLTVQVEATDNFGVVSANLLLDGALLKRFTSPPYNFSWDTREVANGYHILQATARDTTGNEGNISIFVSVNNTFGYTLAIATDGPGVGSVSKSPDQFNYPPGAVVNLTATPASSIFAGWTGDMIGTTTPTTITIDGNRSVTAIFIPTTPTSFKIYASSSSNGAISPSGDFIVNHGDNKSFNMTPNPGYKVANAIIDGFSSAATTTYTFTNVQRNHSIVATFEVISNPILPTCTITSPVDGAEVNGIVTISAEASDQDGVRIVGFFYNSTFLGTDTTSPYTFVWNTAALPNDQYLIRAFAVDTLGSVGRYCSIWVTVKNVFNYTLTTSSNGSGSGSIIRNPDQLTYLEGTIITLTANSSSSSTFNSWSGSINTTANITTIAMYANKSVTATFSLNNEIEQCSSGADTDANGNIDKDELNNYIQQYYLGNVNIDNVSNAIIEHLNGCA